MATPFPIITWNQYKAQEFNHLRLEYPEALTADLRELSEDGGRRAEWTRRTIEAMREGVPTRHQWPALIRELGRDTILRRVFHDEPDAAGRYIAAGLYLPGV